MTIDTLILNDKSRQWLTNYLHHPVQSLLLSGSCGVGLLTIARTLGQELAGNGHVLEIVPMLHEKQKTTNINTDDIRQVIKISQNRRAETSVVIVDDADKMTNSTADIFLKTLEEPGDNLFFILTSHYPEKLSMTIRSRVAEIEILPANFDLDELFSLSTRKLSPQQRIQLHFLADSLPAEMTRLIINEECFRERSDEFKRAREFISGDRSMQLAIASQITKRAEAISLVNDVAKILVTVATRDTQKFIADVTLISITLDNLAANASVKAQMLSLAANLA